MQRAFVIAFATIGLCLALDLTREVYAENNGGCVDCVSDGGVFRCESQVSSGGKVCTLSNGGQTCRLDGACSSSGSSTTRVALIVWIMEVAERTAKPSLAAVEPVVVLMDRGSNVWSEVAAQVLLQ
jgi:hypothetical protein